MCRTSPRTSLEIFFSATSRASTAAHVVPYRSNDLRALAEDVPLQPGARDVIGVDDVETAEHRLAQESQHEQQGRDESQRGQHAQGRARQTGGHCLRRAGTGVSQRDLDHVPKTGRERTCRPTPVRAARRLPHRIERQLDLHAFDASVTLGKGEVVIEQVLLAVALQDVGERVLQHVGDGRAIELGIGWPAAAPAENIPSRPSIVIDLVQRSLRERDLLSALRVDAAHPVEEERLARPDAELPLAAVPVAGEHHDLLLAHVQPAVRIEVRLDRQLVPMELTRDQRQGAHEERENGEAAHEGILQFLCGAKRNAGVPSGTSNTLRRGPRASCPR
jgi:hypothetical protein